MKIKKIVILFFLISAVVFILVNLSLRMIFTTCLLTVSSIAIFYMTKQIINEKKQIERLEKFNPEDLFNYSIEEKNGL